MSSLNRAVKNCLPTIPEEYKAQPVFTPYARLWSVKLWPSRASYTTIKAISLRPALRVKAEGPDPLQHKQCINKATAIFLPHTAGTWRNSYHMYTGRRYRKIDWATTSLRSALNMLTGTPCDSKGRGAGGTKMQQILGWRSRNTGLKNEIARILEWHIQVQVASWGSREQCEAGEQRSTTRRWRLLHALPGFSSKEQGSLWTQRHLRVLVRRPLLRKGNFLCVSVWPIYDCPASKG